MWAWIARVYDWNSTPCCIWRYKGWTIEYRRRIESWTYYRARSRRIKDWISVRASCRKPSTSWSSIWTCTNTWDKALGGSWVRRACQDRTRWSKFEIIANSYCSRGRKKRSSAHRVRSHAWLEALRTNRANWINRIASWRSTREARGQERRSPCITCTK